ncbi:acetyl-CoA carboxylase biotin carboxylase subunit family protein [Streptomyces sp. NPDC091972]|uniref:ATP-grasp domain-containing protein n=1 Tax=Streptomyces sp. NPDC091972 TaxID=3366007 RepID=UPI0038291A4B
MLALHENVVLLAAELRSQYGLVGMDVETATLFRDKTSMKERVRSVHAAPVPEFSNLDSYEVLDKIDWNSGRKVIKSRLGLGANGVQVVDTLDAARKACSGLDLQNDHYEIEDFIDGDIYHCDAVMQDGKVRFESVGRYLANPAAYEEGGFFGTALVTEGQLRERIVSLNEEVLKALGMRDGVTHLELFHTPDDTLVFCEVAGRPAGGGIPAVIEAQHGINIAEISLRLQAGLKVELPPRDPGGNERVCGFAAFYPGRHDGPGVDASFFDTYGVVEHSHHSGAGDGKGGVRHSTDFRDVYIMSASDTQTLEDNVSRLRRQYQGTTPDRREEGD